MPVTLKDMVKYAASSAVARAPHARYNRCLLMLSHMRATTTALSNVLCSHPHITGYGETHVPHGRRNSLGQMIVNLAIRQAFSPKADLLFDKVLHDHLDGAAGNAFYEARALFMLRRPAPAIRSIVSLAHRTDMHHYRDTEAAALYYAERLERLARHWARFPAERRFGLTSEALLQDPDHHVARIGSWLGFDAPPLTNSYTSHRATQKGGGGDPTRSATHTRIEPRTDVGAARDEDDSLPGLSPELAQRSAKAHAVLVARFDEKAAS